MDETEFFFRALSYSTLNHVKQSCKGEKQEKDQFIVALTCSTMHEKLPPLIIGKSKNLRYFDDHDIRKFTAKYSHSAKAWMTNLSFSKYLKDLDDHFNKKRQKFFLFFCNV